MPVPPVASAERYPLLDTYPTYVASVEKIPGSKRFSLADFFEFAAVIVGVLLTFWLGVLLVLHGFEVDTRTWVWLILFWAVMAYLALPRLHQFFTALYVPDYFIARTRTVDGVLADPVNLALAGSAEDIHAAMRNAGWVQADEITLRSAWGIVKSSVLGSSYPEAPVSDLFLFGRRHAFAYQQEVDGNAAQRHHIRFWRVPEGWLLPGGHRVQWLAAGTYDRSVGLSIFTWQVTHKIEANIDKERDYVINTVRFCDPACGVRVIEDFSTAYHHRNGGGDLVYTDGDLPVLDVTGCATRFPFPGAAVQLESPGSRLEQAKNQKLPPTSFLLTGLVILASLVMVGLAWVPFISQGRASLSLADFWTLLGYSSAVLCIGVLWVLTAFRQRFARLLLLLICIFGAAQDLLLASLAEQGSTGNLVASSLSVLVLWAVSSEALRRWVSTEADLA